MGFQNLVTSFGGPSNVSPYDIHTSPRFPVGTRAWLPDGRVFYYTENTGAAALNIGQVIVAAVVAPNHLDLATAAGCMIVGGTSVTDVTLGATAATVNQYKEGYLAVTDGGGEGQIFQVREHAAIASAGTGTFHIYGKIAIASDANTTVSLIRNIYKDPVISVADQLDVLAGIPVNTIPVGSTTTQYGWLQTWGPCPVLCDETVATVGEAMVIGSSTVGAAEEDDTATTVSQEQIIGYNLTPFVDTEYQVVDLRIRP